MDIFILDSLLRQIDVVDRYESFVWAERFASKGDFELVIPATTANRNRFVEDTMLMIDDSDRIMRVKTVEDKIDEEKGAMLTVKGFELSSILEERVFTLINGAEPHPDMLRAVSYFTGFTPRHLIDLFVNIICYPPALLNAGDLIPFLQDIDTPSLYPASNLPEPEPAGITWEQKIDKLYNAVTDLCKSYDLGFRLYKDPSASKLYFEGYVGCDRTTAQSMYTPVVFSSDMSNLLSTTQYNDNTTHYNVVIALYEYDNPTEGESPETLTISQIVSDPELAFSSGGFDQKTKYVSITQLPEGMALVDVPAYLQQIAQEELTRSRPTNVYDGEVDQHALYVYGKDYYLGDLVEVRGDDGGAAFMRVEEQIIKYDANGKASYPSLVTKESINPGTWRSWKYDVNWVDMGSGEYWNNQ